MIKVLIAGLVLFMSSVQAVTLDELQQRFSQEPVVRADFTQQRQIKGMAKPLISNGQMLIAQDKGLWWHQLSPFPLTMVLSETRMVQVMKGQAPQIVTAESNPQMFQFNHLLRALFQADRHVLEQNFTVVFTPIADEQWRLTLIPKTTPLDKLFDTITLHGGAFLNGIELNDRQGDVTRITLSNQRLTPRTLTDDEQQRFFF